MDESKTETGQDKNRDMDMLEEESSELCDIHILESLKNWFHTFCRKAKEKAEVVKKRLSKNTEVIAVLLLLLVFLFLGGKLLNHMVISFSGKPSWLSSLIAEKR